jgi:hypothetical protein
MLSRKEPPSHRAFPCIAVRDQSARTRADLGEFPAFRVASEWNAPDSPNGIHPTGKRFHDVDEIYIFRVRAGKLTDFIAVEDNLARLRQLGFELRPT